MIDVKAEVISWIKSIIITVIAALILSNFVIVNAAIPTASMENTVKAGDRLIALRLSYILKDPKRHDIVVFKNPDYEIEQAANPLYTNRLLVKRIIGLPGETVYIAGGQVYINALNAPPIDCAYIKEPQNTEPYTRFEVPPGCYFMLGDNRNISYDSRYWENPFVEKKAILGQVIFRYYPLTTMKVY